jgi:hypothetical protein
MEVGGGNPRRAAGGVADSAEPLAAVAVPHLEGAGGLSVGTVDGLAGSDAAGQDRRRTSVGTTQVSPWIARGSEQAKRTRTNQGFHRSASPAHHSSPSQSHTMRTQAGIGGRSGKLVGYFCQAPPSGSCVSRRVTLSRGAASHPQRRHHQANSSVSTTPAHASAGQHRTTGLDPLTHDLQAEFVKPAEQAQVRAHEGSVRRIAPIGHPSMAGVVTPAESTGSVGVSARIR